MRDRNWGTRVPLGVCASRTGRRRLTAAGAIAKFRGFAGPHSMIMLPLHSRMKIHQTLSRARFALCWPSSTGPTRPAAHCHRHRPPSTSAQPAASTSVPPPLRFLPELELLPFYSQFPLDRADEVVAEEGRLQQLQAHPSAKLLLAHGSRVLAASLKHAPQTLRLPPEGVQVTVTAAPVLAAAAEPPPLSADGPGLIFLGLDPHDSSPYFAAEVDDAEADAVAARHGGKWQAARAACTEMSPALAALTAVAHSLLSWHKENLYHGASGARMTPRKGGRSRVCSATGRSVYPRIDPAVLALVTCGDYCLLGRKAEWPAGRYSALAGELKAWGSALFMNSRMDAGFATHVSSCASRPLCAQQTSGQPTAKRAHALARTLPLPAVCTIRAVSWGFPHRNATGFLETGEPFEATVVREVMEESGVAVELLSVKYVASQPWPFPRSLMVAFTAEAPALQPSSSTGFDLLSGPARAAAIGSGITQEEVMAVLGSRLQAPRVDTEELADARWFHREWLSRALQAPGSPLAGPFNIPGHYALANSLIRGWMRSQQQAPGGSLSPDLERFPTVNIDTGSFKYVLLRVTDTRSGVSKLAVWGDARADYHNLVLQKAKQLAAQLSPAGLKVQPLGGGRIEHLPDKKVMNVFGYSVAFGPAVHEVSAALLRRFYPLYDAAGSSNGDSPSGGAGIAVSYDGY